MRARKLSLVLVLTWLAACSPFVTATPRPSPQPVQVNYSPTLRPWSAVLHQCANAHPEIALITLETSVTDPDFMGGDLSLWFGEPLQGIPGYAAALETDELVVISGSSMGLQNLNADQLWALYAEANPLYQVWTYAEGNELRAIFEAAILRGADPSPITLIAPNPGAMLEAIAADPLAIGYVPASWLTGDVHTIGLPTEIRAAFEQPILALTDSEPQGELKAYLVCLQNAHP